MRRLVLTDKGGWFTAENSQGQRAQASTLEGAIQKLAEKFGLDFTPTNGHESSEMLESLMGVKRGTDGIVHHGPVTG